MEKPPSRLEIFRVSLKLGLTSFGGPVAHLGYFHEEYVSRRRWFSEVAYVDLVALCQFLPGPASSQLGFAIGLLRGGLLGGILAWLGFTLPSAVLMTLCGYGFAAMTDLTHAGWLEGLKLAAVAIVAQAVWAMATKICPDRLRASVALAVAATMLVLVAVWAQIAMLATGALFGFIILRQEESAKVEAEQYLSISGWSRRAGVISLGLFAALLVGLPLLRVASGNVAVAVFDSFYRSGALVFGGGHVVLPLLQAETVAPGWVGSDRFLAGYGLAQTVPGPLFSISAYLGTVLTPPRLGGWTGALLCLLAIYLPTGLLVWASCRSGRTCVGDRRHRRPCAVRTQRLSGYCWQHSTIRCGRAQSIPRQTSRLRSCCLVPWYSGNCRPGWLSAWQQSAASCSLKGN